MADVRHLPPPKAETWAWQLGAACRGMDISTFYHPDNERGPSRRRRERAAKAICGGCPVTAQCLSWALQTREPYGVWGGKSIEEREALLAVAAAARGSTIGGVALASEITQTDIPNEAYEMATETSDQPSSDIERTA